MTKREGIRIATQSGPAGTPGAAGVERLRPRENGQRWAAASGENGLICPKESPSSAHNEIEGPLVEIGSRSVFVNSVAIRSIFPICNALRQGGLLTLPDVPPSVCYPSGRHRQRRRPKPGGQRNLDPRIGREARADTATASRGRGVGRENSGQWPVKLTRRSWRR